MSYFNISSLTNEEKESMILSKVFNDCSAISLDRLVMLTISYLNFNNEIIKDGKMVVLDVVAENTIKIFNELLDIKFNIDQICLMDKYLANDELSMLDNNSSCYNARKISGSNNLSIHSYGLAIDINPKQNPYIVKKYENDFSSTLEIFPKDSFEYLNRTKHKMGMICDDNKNYKANIVSIFKKHGFVEWGGDFSSLLDYHHFQVKRTDANYLASVNYDSGKEYFQNLY